MDGVDCTPDSISTPPMEGAPYAKTSMFNARKQVDDKGSVGGPRGGKQVE